MSSYDDEWKKKRLYDVVGPYMMEFSMSFN